MHRKIIRLLIADDHELVRDGIRARLEDESDIEIIGEATNGREAVDLASRLEPDLVLLDINMPQMNGLDAIEEMRQKHLSCRVLMLSIYDNPEYIRRAEVLGANGYLLKDVSHSEMVTAIRTTINGGFYVSQALASHLEKTRSEEDGKAPYGLTAREREVLGAVADGKLNKQVAADLNISIRTVESHRSAIRQKTGGGNAASLVRIASELGLTAPENP